ncbi:NACHT, LRR and PYD domains-containing protein 12 [Melanotaenia boesemani]|uniref:NACHT, LRR and PYD domains-containing protein 12 n=1 Tax=Melanotaenia boesemani TaxID=1250792 RepID=UPI001C052A6C|nr:NACHT, LRR and PYD domains-containing protein 12 [Melanotaenia boesemani]XP_041859252.1 NACHT, LRR and PYD domains-containing protein 12 [Melanotaenia boesemani]
MDKAAVQAHILKSKGVPTFLGGELPASVINNNKYIPALTAEAQDNSLASIDHVIRIALSGEVRSVALIGPEGSGKTTALQKLILDWTKGEHLQNFLHVFNFQFREINSLKGVFSLETFMQHNHHLISPESIPLAIEKSDEVLFVFDGLDEYKHSLDPSIYALISDPSQTTSVPCLVASLLQGSLLKGAAFVVASRPTENLKFFSGTQVEVLGFLKPQREAYCNSFFTDHAAASKALQHMNKTLGFYDFCTSPRFCWTVCSIYKVLIDSGEKLPTTVSQLFVSILVHLIQMLSLSNSANRALVLALGRMASHCLLNQHSSCTKEHIDSFGLQQFLTSVNVFLRVNSELESGQCTVSFHSQLMQEFILALVFFLDQSTFGDVKTLLEKHEGNAKFLDFFLSGLSEPLQYRSLEALLGKFNPDQMKDYERWFRSSLKEKLKWCHQDEHHRWLHLLHQAQNENLVKEIVISSSIPGISHSDLSLQDCVAVNYIFTCLGEVERLNLKHTRNFTEEKAEVLAPTLSLSQQITLSQISTGAVHHLASAFSRGVLRELCLSNSNVCDEDFNILCGGLKESKLHKLILEMCKLTRASCDSVASVLTSENSQLHTLQIRFDGIGDLGFTKLCKAMHSPHCRLQDLYLQTCDLTATSMDAFAAALCSGQSQLRKVNLASDEIGDSGLEVLCKALQHPLCQLQSIRLFECSLTAASCSSLKEVLMSDHCSLLELDLSCNELGQEGGLLLCQGLSRPGCLMQSVNLTRCKLTPTVFKELGSLLRNGTCQLKSLSVGLNDGGNQGVKHLWDAVAQPSCMLEELDVEMTGLTDACVEDMCAAVRASKTLKRLEMRNNTLTDASVPVIVQVIKESHIMEELVLRYNEFSEDVFNMLEECNKIIY